MQGTIKRNESYHDSALRSQQPVYFYKNRKAKDESLPDGETLK